MTLFDKLKFWEKKEEFPSFERYPTGIPDSIPPWEAATPGTPEPLSEGIPGFDSPTAPPRPMPSPQAFPSVQPIERQMSQEQPKDLEIISLKLDAVKNALESINMRLERLENMIAGKSEQEQHKVWYR